MNSQHHQNFKNIIGDNDEDTTRLREMAGRAQEYIESFSWCPPIAEMHLGFGIGGVVAIFLTRFSLKINGTDDMLWVVVGDVPSAYLVVEGDDSPAQALEQYCCLMDDWAAAVQCGNDLNEVFPVSAAPTFVNAEMLKMRMKVLRAEIIPQFHFWKSGGVR